VLPKDIAVPDLLTTMRSFAAALGVNCGYCHVWEAGGQNNDMPSDAKAPKQTARAMLTMTRDLNAALAKGLNRPVTQVAQVRCITCHRGAAIPTAE
jgi:predicted trehalose synthase